MNNTAPTHQPASPEHLAPAFAAGRRHWGTVSLIYVRITHQLLAATNRLRNDPHSRHWVRDVHHRPMSEILFRSDSHKDSARNPR